MAASTARTAYAAGLGARMRGDVLAPGDPGYEGARHNHNRRFDAHPAVIARCACTDDVIAAVAFARREGLEVAVRGGGHSVAGLCSVNGGLVIDLSRMREVRVDAAAGIARAGGGALSGDLDRATHAFGLATPTATVSTVGVAGFTLGGGIGYLARAHGLAADNLVAADVVLADGALVHTSRRSEPDLFWALRGGGGNFGVVTELRFRLHPVAGVIGGPMLWPLGAAERILGLYARWQPEQPPGISAVFAAFTIPPADSFPEGMRLRKVCGLVWCNTAAAEASAAALDTFRAEAPPLLDAVAEMPLPALQSAFDPVAAIGSHHHVAGQCFASLPDGAAAEVVRFGAEAPSWLSFTHLYPIDGAAAQVGEDETAWPWRRAAFAQMFAGVGDGPGRDAELRDWATGFSHALAPGALGGAYSNFLMDEGRARTRAAYGSCYPRLARVKARFDPENVFHVNQNIPPSAD
jgi:FAD binding domain/Berberine and berberine like